MSTLSYLVDPYADTLELPISGDLGPVSPTWEREQIEHHLGTQFQVVREIGRGGMGVVLLARDIALHRLVAIKVLRHEFTSSDEHRERFRREARMTARLSHPNIVPVHSFGEVDDLTNFEEIQKGLAAQEDEWVYMHRGMDIPGRITTDEHGIVTAPATDEVFMRLYIHHWKELMKASPVLAVKRAP